MPTPYTPAGAVGVAPGTGTASVAATDWITSSDRLDRDRRSLLDPRRRTASARSGRPGQKRRRDGIRLRLRAASTVDDRGAVDRRLTPPAGSAVATPSRTRRRGPPLHRSGVGRPGGVVADFRSRFPSWSPSYMRYKYVCRSPGPVEALSDPGRWGRRVGGRDPAVWRVSRRRRPRPRRPPASAAGLEPARETRRRPR